MATTEIVNGIHVTTGDFRSEQLIGNDKRINFLPSLRKSGKDFMIGAGGNDRIYGRGESDTLLGNQGNDRLFGEDGDDNLYGQQSNDNLSGDRGNDRLYGDTQPVIVNNYQDITYRFSSTSLRIAVPGGRDRLDGGDGNDTLYGGPFNDTLYGQRGNDYLYGDEGDDVLIDSGDFDDSGQDFLFGDSGNDLLLAGRGNERLDGGRGRDTLVGGIGRDILTGGRGTNRERDIFHFNNLGERSDIITDFNRLKADKIQVNRSNFPSLSRFRYESATGRLLYNQTHFVTLQNKPDFQLSSDLVFVDFSL